MTFIEELPAGNGIIAEQFRRAALSIVLNIAEGSGKSVGRDRNRFYRIAIGSAMECGALLDICQIMRVINSPRIGTAKDILRQTVGILASVANPKDYEKD